MQSTDKLIAALITSATLLLAACGGSSNKTAQTPEPVVDPALEAAKTAAKTAKTAADTAKTAADTAKTNAGTAVMHVIPIQTGKQSDTLLEAHNALPEPGAVGDPDEAEDVAAAKAIETAAGNAKTAADKRAEAAQKVIDAAMMELQYGPDKDNEGTHHYSVGSGDNAMSINPTTIGKKKTTVTEDGKTMVTGLIETLSLMSEEQTAVTTAGKQKPKIAPRTITISKKYDSADDTKRLWLVTHYVGSGAASLFRDIDNSKQYGLASQRTPRDATNSLVYIREDQMDAWDHDANYRSDKFNPEPKPETPPVKVVKASGKFFYADDETDYGNPDLDQPLKGIIGEQEIRPETKAYQFIYYYIIPEGAVNAGTKRWLRRKELTSNDDEVTGKDGFKLWTYQRIEVVEAKVPMSTPYEHMNYGLWASLDENGIYSGLGVAFVHALPDKSMTGSDMPASGSATYKGSYVALVRGASSDNPSEQSGKSTVTADFGKSTVEVVLGVADEGLTDDGGSPLTDDDSRLATLEGTISDDSFSGTKVTDIKALGGLTASANTGDNGGDYTGKFSGAFFGPKAAEVGGIFDFSHKSDKSAFRGAFGGSCSAHMASCAPASTSAGN